MTIRFDQGDDPPVDLLAATEGLYRETAEELIRAMQGIRAGQLGEVKAATQAVKDLRAALHLVMEERNRVEKSRREIAGAVGAGALDLGAARDEIGRRLARLRDAG